MNFARINLFAHRFKQNFQLYAFSNEIIEMNYLKWSFYEKDLYCCLLDFRQFISRID